MQYIFIALMLSLNLALLKSQTPPNLEVVSRTSHFNIAKNSMTAVDTVLIQINNRDADTEIIIP